ncbi:uncharacterized protein EV420DRAFT_1635012 [Desarmillaria tabescens]|uniref:F-box domain-containing protein n=1 Tax=Armillaria tabescens TaxID=1929756 RepID=A0AA39NLJ9_ARMTA|nr:uncharacterized protein EV420DRAFT_1635012 [Desarmillaria tabescens]KAK0467749.1 hypothetical protein EV420DRAFT_1635012 [Desarmillaria tabescens]
MSPSKNMEVELSRSPNPSIAIPEIPVEVIEEILDNLHTDKSALKSCSLVSRPFYPRTRQYLFQHAFIYHIGQETLLRLHNLALTSPHIFQRFKSFIDALSTASRLETLKLTILIPSFEDFAEEDDMWDMFIELSLVLSGYRVFRCLEVTYECDFYVEEEVKAQMLSWTWTGFAFLHERDALKVELSGYKVEYLKV